MRKSKRAYLNSCDIESGVCSDSFNCAVKVCVNRLGLLKGKCFGVEPEGIFVGPNRKIINRWMEEGREPQIKFTENTTKWINSFDRRKNKALPTHITLIDSTGEFLQ